MSQLTDDVHDIVSLVESKLGTDPWFTAYKWSVASDESHHELHWCWVVSPNNADKS